MEFKENLFIFCIAAVLYFLILNLLYLYDHYVGFLMNLILGAMILSVLVISIISEMIQKSKIKQSYFWGLAGCVVAALICTQILQYDISQ